MSKRPMPRRLLDKDDAVDAFAAGLVDEIVSGGVSGPDQSSQRDARRDAVDGAVSSRALVISKEPPLWGSRSFFRRAAEELITSTKTGRELAGACFVREQRGRVVLAGMKREVSGLPGRVPIEPEWGQALWHTHPGLRGSLAAFSLPDLEVARLSGKPLLVIGFTGFSLDVLSTLAMPFGLKAALASGGVKALLALAKNDKLPTKILEYGAGARVCWPSGRIAPVLRIGAAPWQAALDDMSFTFDSGVGAVERAGQRALRGAMSVLFDKQPPTSGA